MAGQKEYLHDEEVDDWLQSKKEAITFNKQEPLNFVEISRVPKKMDITPLVSIIVKASRIIPERAQFCTRQNDYGESQQAVLVEFNSESDAFKAVSKLKSTPYGKLWIMKLVKNPKLVLKPK